MQGSKRDTDVKNRLGLCGRRRGWDYLRDSIETCILPYVKQMTSPSSMHQTGHSKPVHWDSSEGRDGGSGQGNTCTLVADSCQCVARTTTIW